MAHQSTASLGRTNVVRQDAWTTLEQEIHFGETLFFPWWLSQGILLSHIADPWPGLYASLQEQCSPYIKTSLQTSVLRANHLMCLQESSYLRLVLTVFCACLSSSFEQCTWYTLFLIKMHLTMEGTGLCEWDADGLYVRVGHRDNGA